MSGTVLALAGGVGMADQLPKGVEGVMGGVAEGVLNARQMAVAIVAEGGTRTAGVELGDELPERVVFVAANVAEGRGLAD